MFESVCLTKVIIIFQDLPIIKMYIPNEAVQFEIYLFTEEQMLRRQMGRGGRIDVLIAEERTATVARRVRTQYGACVLERG